MFGRQNIRKTKKEQYNESPVDLRTYVEGDIAIKPYYYLRNGLLHVRYTVDRCVELSRDEADNVKAEMTMYPYAKQDVLSKAWNFFTTCVNKPIIEDGIKAVENRIKGGKDGYKNQGGSI